MISFDIGNSSLLVVSIITAFIAFFVLRKNPTSALHRSFFVFAFGGTIWVSGVALIFITHSFLFERMINYGGLTFIFGFFIMSLSLPVPMRFSINRFVLCIPFLIDALYIIPAGNLINAGMTFSNNTLTPIPGPYILTHSLILASYTILGVIILLYKQTHAQGKEKLRIKYLSLGTGIFAATGVFFDAILPACGITQFNVVGPLCSIIFISLMAYAVVRHELMDIRIVIQRGLIYTVMFGLIVACYIAILNLIGIFVDKSSDSALVGTGIVTTIIGIMGVPFIERHFRKATDGIFFKDKYDYAEALHQLSAIVYTMVEFDTLVAWIERTLQGILKNDSVRLVFATKGRNYVPRIESTSPAISSSEPYLPTLSIPIDIEGSQFGMIICAEKKSGDYYTPEDVKLLQTFSYQAATALGRARLYREVKEYAAMLETKVRERTEELRHAQENQKQMMIDISHNLQTPLTIFQTKIEQLKKVLPDDAIISAFESSLQDLSNFIYNLMALAKLEHQQIPVAVDTIDMHSFMQDVVEEITVIADDKDIAVHHSIAHDVSVHGNAKELRQAVFNILSNAIKYMKPEGAKELHISLTKKNDSALVSIRDNGIGLSESDQTRIFERFYRVKKSKTAVGTGLGLAITKQIITRHNGRIWCESEEGVGSTFFIELPVIS